jgi:nucleoside-diphosphate-sugar epimerase
MMKMAAKVGDVLHLPLNTERLGKLTEDSFVDNSELKKLLGWTNLPIAAEEGMRMTLEDFTHDEKTLEMAVDH